MNIQGGARHAEKSRHGHALCSIAPPDVLVAVIERGSPEERAAAISTLVETAALRAERDVLSGLSRQLNIDIADLVELPPASAEKQRTVYDARHGGPAALPGIKVRAEGDPPSIDEAVNEAYDGSGVVYDFYRNVHNRNSVDGKGLELVSSVHYKVNYDNAGWSPLRSQMLYGDGSGRIFMVGSLTKEISVIAHELTHGVTQFTAGLVYHKAPGALNESFSDVFGSLVKQYGRGETADEADWLIGEGILGSALHGPALRSMKAPGTAHDLDTQPAHMNDYMDLPDDDEPGHDNGGVHINSGIPNKAFYLAATAIGGYAWEKAGLIWYVTLTDRLRPHSGFLEAAEATVEVAGELFGSGEVQEKVGNAWQQVGVLT
jgi:Zn-dependent metalloprotease